MYLRRIAVSVLVALTIQGAATAGSNPAQARIAVTSAESVRTIPSTLFGTNLEWIWNGNLLWDSTADAPASNFAGHVTELAPPILRFPGGFFADYYDWRDGVGPQNARPTTQFLPGGSYSRHSFGTDEALRLARLVNGELLITVNAGTGTASLAADWVRYVRNSPSGPAVRYWEIGNELYLPASLSAETQAPSLSATEYARRFVEFAAAMKAVDPSIKVGAILDEPLGGTESTEWTDTVLRIAGSHIDFVSVHNSYAPVLATGGEKPVREVYAAMLASPALIARSLQSLAERLDRDVPQQAGKIGIAVTEWGPFFHFDFRHRYADHPKTMGSALFTASALMTFMRSPRTDIANFFKLNDFLSSGLIGMRGNEPAPTAPFLALRMLKGHIGGHTLPVAVESAGFDSEAVGFVPAVRNSPYLDVIATLSDDRSTLLLTVVNRHFDSAIETTVDLGPFGRSGAGAVRALVASALDANTGTTPWAATGIQVGTQAEDQPHSRFQYGAPEEVRVENSVLPESANTFSHSFPAASVTTLEIPVGEPGSARNAGSSRTAGSPRNPIRRLD